MINRFQVSYYLHGEYHSKRFEHLNDALSAFSVLCNKNIYPLLKKIEL